MFDNARDLDQAARRLARAGFGDTVYDEAIHRGRDTRNRSGLAPGYAPPAVWGSGGKPNLSRGLDLHTIVRLNAFVYKP
jgi:hypothetical protein